MNWFQFSWKAYHSEYMALPAFGQMNANNAINKQTNWQNNNRHTNSANLAQFGWHKKTIRSRVREMKKKQLFVIAILRCGVYMRAWANRITSWKLYANASGPVLICPIIWCTRPWRLGFDSKRYPLIEVATLAWHAEYRKWRLEQVQYFLRKWKCEEEHCFSAREIRWMSDMWSNFPWHQARWASFPLFWLVLTLQLTSIWIWMYRTHIDDVQASIFRIGSGLGLHSRSQTLTRMPFLTHSWVTCTRSFTRSGWRTHNTVPNAKNTNAEEKW